MASKFSPTVSHFSSPRSHKDEEEKEIDEILSRENQTFSLVRDPEIGSCSTKEESISDNDNVIFL